ncbi:MAG: FCD domain-containing protein [Anaerolineales bacterium]
MADPFHFSDFLAYLSERASEDDDTRSLPSLSGLSEELDISISRLREQLEVAKALGLVEVRPRVGIRSLPYRFAPSVRQSLFYAIKQDHKHFEDFLDLRRHIEYAYLPQAVEVLTKEDKETLRELIHCAWEKLKGRPVRIPHEEHRKFHLTIFQRLENVFVTGLLEAYWDAYEAVGLDVYADMEYLEKVWQYHEKLVESIIAGEMDRSLQLLKDHFDLLIDRLAS